MSVDEHYVASIIELVSQLPPGSTPYSLTSSEVWSHAASSHGPMEHWPESCEDFIDRGPGFFRELINYALERTSDSESGSHINPEKVISSLSLKLVETPSGEALKVELTPSGEDTLTDYVTPGRFTVELTPDKLSLTRVRKINIDQVVVNRSEPSQ